MILRKNSKNQHIKIDFYKMSSYLQQQKNISYSKINIYIISIS